MIAMVRAPMHSHNSRGTNFKELEPTNLKSTHTQVQIKPVDQEKTKASSEELKTKQWESMTILHEYTRMTLLLDSYTHGELHQVCVYSSGSIYKSYIRRWYLRKCCNLRERTENASSDRFVKLSILLLLYLLQTDRYRYIPYTYRHLMRK